MLDLFLVHMTTTRSTCACAILFPISTHDNVAWQVYCCVSLKFLRANGIPAGSLYAWRDAVGTMSGGEHPIPQLVDVHRSLVRACPTATSDMLPRIILFRLIDDPPGLRPVGA
jgi:hypothetical protein